jgi:hypothetical protein
MSKLVSFITVAALTLIGASGAACAQTTTGTTAPRVAAASTQTSATTVKEQLIKHLLELWHVDNVGVIMLQKPVAESLRQSRSLLQGRVSSEKQEAAMKEINQDAVKFMEDVTPVVRASAQKLIPSTVAPLLAEKFTEDELRQIIAIMESPVKAKFEALIPEMEKSLGEKIATDTGAVINPKLTELTQQIGVRMRTAINP